MVSEAETLTFKEAWASLRRASKDAVRSGMPPSSVVYYVWSAILEERPDYSSQVPGIISLAEAAEKYRVPPETMECWMNMGVLNGFGSLTFASKESVFAYEKDVAALVQDGPVFDWLPAGAIDLPSASKKYGISRPLLRQWLVKGHVRFIGRLRGRARGGGVLLMEEDDLVAYMNAPRNKGGRPKGKRNNPFFLS